MNDKPSCRPGCGACCIAPSIGTALPGMPQGKPAGIRCIHLTDELLCELFANPCRPPFCSGLTPSHEMCGDSQAAAMAYLEELDRLTAPTAPTGESG